MNTFWQDCTDAEGYTICSVPYLSAAGPCYVSDTGLFYSDHTCTSCSAVLDKPTDNRPAEKVLVERAAIVRNTRRG